MRFFRKNLAIIGSLFLIYLLAFSAGSLGENNNLQQGIKLFNKGKYKAAIDFLNKYLQKNRC